MDTAAAGRAGPLAGLRVVELAGIGPAPYAAMLLADLGAEVVRVDRPGGGTTYGSPATDVLNRGRRSVAVDLKQPAGVEVVLALAAGAEVLLEGFRPGVMERLGLGPEQVRARNPRCVYGRMTGWGQDGPWAQAAGHDIGYLAVTGVLGSMGRAGGPPQVPLNLVGDFGGGSLFLVMGVLAAVLEARRSGVGQVVDAAIVDGASSLASMQAGMLAAGLWQDTRGANLLDTGAPFYDVYEAADGGHLAVGALEPQFYAEFVRLLGLSADAPAQHDRDRWEELRAAIAACFRTRTRDAWAEVFAGTDACVAPVLSFTEAPHHPQVEARGTWTTVEGVLQPSPAPRFSRTPGAVGSPPCRPGEHSRAVLADWGVTGVDALIDAGVVTQLDAP